MSSQIALRLIYVAFSIIFKSPQLFRANKFYLFKFKEADFVESVCSCVLETYVVVFDVSFLNTSHEFSLFGGLSILLLSLFVVGD